MYFKNVAVFCLIALTLSNYVRCEEVWDKIKHAYNVAYDEVHCEFHKVKETFKHHDHDHGTDPCKYKPSRSTTEKNVNIYGVNEGQPVEPLQPNQQQPFDNNNGAGNPTTPSVQYANQYGWQQ